MKHLPSVMVAMVVMVVLVILATVTGYEIGRRYERYRLNLEHNPLAGSRGTGLFRGKLLPGSYYGTISGLRFSLVAASNGSLQLIGAFHGKAGISHMHLFQIRFRRKGRLGVPSIVVGTTWQTRGNPPHNRAYFWRDVGVCGRFLFKAGRTTANGKVEKFWRLHGRWVRGAKLIPPYLVYRGVRYRYDRHSGHWDAVRKLVPSSTISK
jgi:hypothetical protein